MVFGQETLLTPEQEKIFKGELISLREQGYTAKQIAKALNFGEPKSPYEKLNSSHVYYYVQYFGLKRKIKKRHKVTEEHIDPKLKNLYVRWIPGMPENIANSARKDGFLLNDPLDEET